MAQVGSVEGKSAKAKPVKARKPKPARVTGVAARIVVSVVFAILAASFIAETAVMIWEFKSPFALSMMTFDSHLFLFFPTFGLIGLFAFWRAAVVIVDAYWRRVPLGKPILAVSIALLVAAAGYLAWTFQQAPNRLWWEVSKEALLADPGEPAGCRPPACDRAPIREAYGWVREAAGEDQGLTGLSDECKEKEESVFRVAVAKDENKFCFVTGRYSAAPECCQAKIHFKEAVTALHAQSPSLTHYVHAWMMPFKVFFLLCLLAIGITLARRRTVLEAHYPRAMEQVERLMPIGALSMMIWPLMNQAYTQSFDLLYGAGGSGAFRVTAPLYTIAFGGWVMILMFYYFRRYPKQTEGAAKAMGGVAAVVGILKYEAVLAWVNHYLGAGAGVVSIAVLLVIAAFLAYETVFHTEDPYPEIADHPFEKAPLPPTDDAEPDLGEVVGDLVD